MALLFAWLLVSSPPTFANNVIDIAVDDFFTVAANAGPTALDVLANDIDDAFSFACFLEDVVVSLVSQPNQGGSASVSGQKVIYTPPPNTTSDVTEMFKYKLIYDDGDYKTECGRATVTVMVIADVDARDDRFTVDTNQGTVTLNVLGNDTGSGLQLVSVTGGSRGGTTSISGNRIRYTSPQGFIGGEEFRYTIRGGGGQDTARVSINVTAPNAVVPTGSIGKIPSNLPVARASENLCDLLTFQGDSRTFVNDPRSQPGQLTSAQQDLQTCTCAIVNEADQSKQLNALQQVSGGQFQHGDTMIRFSRGNIAALVSRLSAVRTIVGVTRLGSNRSGERARALTQQTSLQIDGTEVLARADDDGHRSVPRDNLEFYERLGLEQPTGTSRHTTPDRLRLDEGVVLEQIKPPSSFYFNRQFGGAAGDDGGLTGNRWGVFVSGSVAHGDGEEREAQFNFDFDSYEITAGVDYLMPKGENATVVGVAVSVSETDADTAGGLGGVESESVSLSLYGSWFNPDGWFAEGILGFAKHEFSTTRILDYGLAGKTVLQTAAGDSDGDEVFIGLGGGRAYLLSKGYTLTVSGNLNYLDGTIDGLKETIGNSESGFALALETDDTKIESFRSSIDLQLAKAISTGRGVLQPYVGASWIHEFEDRGNDITARFLADPFSENFVQLELDAPGGSNRPTVFVIPGDENDANYFRLNAGSSAQFAGGKSAWIALTAITGLRDIDSYIASLGFRWELP
jgi:outer membrane autotransporter protein